LDMKPEEIFVPEFLQQAPPESWTETAEGHFRRADAATELNRLLYLDVKITLADNDLRKVAGTAEMAGIRVRYPLLDKELAEMSGRIPSALKLKGSEKRYIFKKAMSGILPNKVLYKKKHGFGVPISRWFLEEPRLRDMMETSLSDQGLKDLGIFRSSFISRLKELHRQEPGYYGESIWYLVVLDTWLQRHATGKLMSHV
jgi:asparagine synthase (glutamine-hydrolysing)